MKEITEFFCKLFTDTSTPMERFILSRNPQTALHVEQLEREYNSLDIKKHI
jgi:hypothetical protein